MTKPDDREHILTQTRNLKMARSAHAYVRGSTVKFYDWLENSRPGELPGGPPVWICGDCHIGNLGPLADAKGHVLIQIRDLDQTVIDFHERPPPCAMISANVPLRTLGAQGSHPIRNVDAAPRAYRSTQI